MLMRKARKKKLFLNAPYLLFLMKPRKLVNKLVIVTEALFA